jgi:hypothetical protein
MFCVKCGAENPNHAEFCHKCGSQLYSPTNTGTETLAGAPQISPPVPPVRSGYRWAMVYGWLFIVAGVSLVVAGLVNLLSGQDVTPPASPFGSAKPMGIVSSLAQGLLFFGAGLAIVRRKKIAVALVWAVTALSGLGVLFRGLVPLDILVWLVSLGLAIWYAKKAPFLTT